MLLIAELASLMIIYPLGDGLGSKNGQSLDSFYVTESTLSVTNIAEMAIFI